MERVGILIDKLQEQFRQNTGAEKMLVTAQLLCAELMVKAEQNINPVSSKISVVLPNNVPAYTAKPSSFEKNGSQSNKNDEAPFVYIVQPKPPVQQNSVQKEVVADKATPVVEKQDLPPVKETPLAQTEAQPVRQFEQKEPEKKDIDKKEPEKKEPVAWSFDPKSFDPKEVPTLAHQQKAKTHYELNEILPAAENSLNDKLKEEKTEVASVLSDVPIRDLKKAISINDRHRFIDHLFRGDEAMYERSIKTINNFIIFAEAEFWIQRELKLKLGWNNDLAEVKLFDQLVKRRFITT